MQRKQLSIFDAANPSSCLAEIFNDYEAPQNLMAQYVAAGHDQHPVKRTPFIPKQCRINEQNCSQA
jgi:hypothetical protein